MLEYDMKDTSEGIKVNKTNSSKECDIYHYWYFLDKGSKFEPYVCNGFYDLMQKAMSFNDAIASVKGNDNKIHFWHISKNDPINMMKNSDLNEKSGLLWFFFSCFDIKQKALLKKWALIFKEIEKD